MASKSVPSGRTGAPLAMEREETRERRGTLEVRSSTIDREIPRAQSEYGEGVSPGISWDPVEGAESYALILEDPDAKQATPFVHWVAWNIPADTTALPEGFNETPDESGPAGLLQGRTSAGSIGYFGPRPPVGDSPHHYHFQVFALDTELDIPDGAEREEVLAAMDGHVIAAGELVGIYQQVSQP